MILNVEHVDLTVWHVSKICCKTCRETVENLTKMLLMFAQTSLSIYLEQFCISLRDRNATLSIINTGTPKLRTKMQLCRRQISDYICCLLCILLLFFLTNYRSERSLYVKLKDWMSLWIFSSGSMLFAKAHYYRLWQWKRQLRELYTLYIFSTILQGRHLRVTFCLLSYTYSTSGKESALTRKNLLPAEQILSFSSWHLFRRESVQFRQGCLPWKCIDYP